MKTPKDFYILLPVETVSREIDYKLYLSVMLAKKGFKIAMPGINSSSSMHFRTWIFKQPLYVSNFGILEPKNVNQKIIPDVIMVPLVAFDRHLNRIGYGKGYYDRYLSRLIRSKKSVLTIGLAFSFQKYKKIPTIKSDIKLDYILTEKGIF